MHRRSFIPLTLLLLVSLSCQMWIPGQEAATVTPFVPLPSQTPTLTPTLAPGETPVAQSTPTPSAGQRLAALGGDSPFARYIKLGKNLSTNDYNALDKSLPLDLTQLGNPGVIAGLSDDQQKMLAASGFTVVHTQEEQFQDIRIQVSEDFGQPYYLTTDAAYHSLHETFNQLLKALEGDALRPQLIDLTRAALGQVLDYLTQVKGTPLEADTQQAAAYLSVGLKLLDPPAQVDRRVQDMVTQQLRQIQNGGREKSAVVPDFEDDYSAYKPVGHYAGEPNLESYFQAMTWFGRVHFKLADTSPNFKPSRAPLIITLALRQANIESINTPAAAAWTRIYEIIGFIIGPTDDTGPREYAQLMDKVYGSGATIQDLGDAAKWQEFLQERSQLPAPRLHSTFADTTADNQTQVGWRFLGQRFTLDGYILQNMIFDKVGTPDKKRSVPSGLDVMSALGSQPAAVEQNQAGETAYANYPQQMQKMQQAVKARAETEWLAGFYDAWMYAFSAQLAPRGSTYPAHMRSLAWAYKELNTALGSWAELKHDTVLYAKMPEALGGGGPPASGPAPAYVEPDPDVFYRLSYAATTLAQGLVERNFDPTMGQYPDSADGKPGLDRLIEGTSKLGDTFAKFANIAVTELAGRPPSADDLELIQDCLGPVECRAMINVHAGDKQSNLLPIPLAAAVSGAGSDVLEAATGKLDRIYVVVTLENKLQVAQGGVFSYYEFTQPRDSRLTDAEWQQKLQDSPPAAPAWVSNFRLPGGQPQDALAMRVGDTYLVTDAGGGLNLRSAPSTTGAIQQQLPTGTYVKILDGPRQADQYTWWQVQVQYDGPTGWLVEWPGWFDRAHGQ